VGKFDCTLQSFKPENQIQFLEQYCSEVTEIPIEGNLEILAKQLLSLCSQNFGDQYREFTGIPLQKMMLGEAFVNEAKQYCCSGEYKLPEKFNLLSFFKKFIENKFNIYFRENNKIDISIPEIQSYKEDYVEEHMISALK